MERRLRLRRGTFFLGVMLIVAAICFVIPTVMAADLRVHNATAESIVMGAVTIAPGDIETVTIPGNVLSVSRTTVAGSFEAWAVDAENDSLVTLRPGGASQVYAESVDRLSVFMKGFTFMTLLELFGLTLRIVRKIKSPTTAI